MPVADYVDVSGALGVLLLIVLILVVIYLVRRV